MEEKAKSRSDLKKNIYLAGARTHESNRKWLLSWGALSKMQACCSEFILWQKSKWQTISICKCEFFLTFDVQNFLSIKSNLQTQFLRNKSVNWCQLNLPYPMQMAKRFHVKCKRTSTILHMDFFQKLPQEFCEKSSKIQLSKIWFSIFQICINKTFVWNLQLVLCRDAFQNLIWVYHPQNHLDLTIEDLKLRIQTIKLILDL